MKIRIARQALVALAGAGAVYGLALAGVLPWPMLAARSLAVICLLAAITRIGGDQGLVSQRRLRWAVGGVALTAGAWFVGAAFAFGVRDLTILGFLHLAAAWLTAAPERDPAERTRGWLILSSTATAVSLLAMGSLPAAAARVHGAPLVPLALAAVTIVGATQIAQGRVIGLVLTAIAGLVTVTLAVDILLDVFAVEAAAFGAAGAPLGRSAPLLAATAILGALAPIAALASQLPALFRQLIPGASPALRVALVWLTIPVVLFASAALL